MKFLYISDSSIPSQSANSIHVMKMCQALGRLPLHVTLIGKKTAACLHNIEDIHKFYGVQANFRLKTYPIKSFPLSGRIYNLTLPLFSIKSFDFAYTRAIYPAFWYSLFGKKIGFEIHEPFNTKNKWLKWVFEYIVKSGAVNKWVVISSPLKDYLIDNFNIDPDKILIAHDGADSISHDKYEPIFLSEKFKVGYVGSLLKGKGMELIFDLSKSLPEVDFHVIGGTKEQLTQWQKLMTEEHTNLIFHGFKPHSETPNYLLSFDILIAPYLNEVYVKNSTNSNNIAQWMSPLKIFEYMSVGKPILTSDLPVLREILVNDESALLCNPEKLEDWKNSVNRLKDDHTLASRIGLKAKTDFENNYTWKKRAENIFKFISN